MGSMSQIPPRIHGLRLAVVLDAVVPHGRVENGR